MKGIEPYALIFKDHETGDYTMTYNGTGGAIVSASTLPEVAEKFVEAMNLAHAVKFANTYKENSSNHDHIEIIK